MNTSVNFCADIQLKIVSPALVHIDLASCRAANWVDIRGWIADVDRGKACAVSNWEWAHFVLSDRPDVCVALDKSNTRAYGFAIQLLARKPFPCGDSHIELSMGGVVIAHLHFNLPKNDLPPVNFATDEAIKLTRRLYRGSVSGKEIETCDEAISLADGVIAPRDSVPGFDNTRIGNYHPDVPRMLSQPGVIGLDVGCGIRDVVFDNLVTQDIYPTPTATLVTRPEQTRLPFPDEVFDLLVLDSVLEHVPDPVAFLAEGRRVLKQGGVIIGDVPFLQPLHLIPHHYFNFTPYGLEVTAGKAGLSLEYVKSEAHQRPEFTFEWLLQRTFDMLPPAEAMRLRNMSLGDFLAELSRNKHFIGYSDDMLTELAAGYHFRMLKPKPD